MKQVWQLSSAPIAVASPDLITTGTKVTVFLHLCDLDPKSYYQSIISRYLTTAAYLSRQRCYMKGSRSSRLSMTRKSDAAFAGSGLLPGRDTRTAFQPASFAATASARMSVAKVTSSPESTPRDKLISL